MPPSQLAPASKPLSGRFLSFAEREEIAIWRAQRHGVRAIARRPKPKRAITIRGRYLPEPRDPSQNASEKPGAVQGPRSRLGLQCADRCTSRAWSRAPVSLFA